MEFSENSFQKNVAPHIKKCRDGDWNHAKRVVRWVKELAEDNKDTHLLITAAYIHDIGWRDVLPPQKLTFEKLLQYEEQANKNSEPFITSLLQQLNYSQKDINTVLKLVNAADKHDSKNDFEAIIVDADNLSKLDINHLKDKFKEEEWLKMYEMWAEEFPKRIRTEKGRKIYLELLNKLKDALTK